MALAKLTRPTSVNTIARPRLFRILDQAGKKPVTWVWAPPGAGKTTLVSSYLAAKRLRTLWYQVDSGDNDLATFFYYLGLAAPKRKRSMALFTPEYQQGLPTFTRNFFRELFSRLKPPFAVVFDNYQEIDSDSPLHEALQGALAEIPPRGRVIFITRSDTPAPFAALRAKQAVEIVEWDELRFTRGEVQDLVKRLAPKGWPKAAIEQLYETADGWAAGVVLLLEHFHRDPKTALESERKSSQVLFDYFAGEIFKRTDPKTQEVLLMTAFLPWTTAKMAEELTGNPDAGEILARLNRQNYFTNRIAGSEPTYQYHPLFREFLLAEGRRIYTAEYQKEIQCCAARIAKVVGRIEAAAELYRDAEAWDELTKLICENAQTFMGQGRMKVVVKWIGFVPQSLVADTPWLLYWRGMFGSGWQHNKSQKDLERCFQKFKERQDVLGMLLSASALLLCIQGSYNSTPMDPWMRVIETLIAQLASPLPLEIETVVAATMLSGVAVRQPDHPDGQRWAVRAMELARLGSNLAFRALTALNWLIYYTEVGNISRAAVVIDDLRSLMVADNASAVVIVNASMGISFYEWVFALSSYRRTVSRVLDLAESSGMFYAAKAGVLTHGLYSALSEGEIELAEFWLGELEKDSRLPFGPGFHCLLQATIVRLALMKGELGSAAAHQPEMLRLGTEAGWPLIEAMVRLISALVLDLRGAKEEAYNHIVASLEIARTMKSPYVEFMVRKTEAHICFENGEGEKAFKSLRIAMELGRKGGFVNSQVWQPNIIARLCAKSLEHGIEVEYVQMLIRKRNLVPEEAPVDIETWPWPIRIYTLGEFRVLRDDQPISFSHKVQRKPLALLKTIIALGGKSVSEDTLLDTLWPDAEGDAARFALTSAIHRLRKLLGYDQAIIRQGNVVSLDNRYCWVDVRAVERLVERCEELLQDNGAQERWREGTELMERALKLYRGPFLKGDAEVTSSARVDRLRRRLTRLVSRLGQDWEWKEEFEQAAKLYEEAFLIDPCAEDLCRRLMTTYHRLGRPAEAARIYKQFQEAIFQETGARPSLETESLARKTAQR